MAKKKKIQVRKAPAKKKSHPRKKAAVGKPAAAKAVGSVSFHKKQAYNQVKEELAWLLLARDQEHRKGERKKLTKKVRLKRIELNKLK